jgi:hypothetical protein
LDTNPTLGLCALDRTLLEEDKDALSRYLFHVWCH